MGQNVVITGATGVLGSRLLRSLKQAKPDWKFHKFSYDLGDIDSVQIFCKAVPVPDLLVHLGAIVPTRHVSDNPMRAYGVNTFGTAFILGNLLNLNPNLWTLYVSTSHVYFPDQGALSETSRLAPVNTYGRTKLAAEFLATDLVGANEDNLCIARVFSMYSPDQHESFLFPKLLRLVDQPPETISASIPGWNNVRDFLSADEIAERLAQLVLGRAGGIYNVGSGIPTTIAQFASSVIGKNLVFGEDTQDASPTSLFADISKYERFAIERA